MQAIDIMQTKLVTVSPRDTVIHAAQLMLDNRISGLPVVEDDGRLVGIVTEGDLIHRVENDTERTHSLLSEMFASPARLAAEFVKATGRQVKDVMTREPIAAPETALLADIAELFDKHRIRRVPVTRGINPVGIVTRADLLRALVGSGMARPGDLAVIDYR